MTSPALEHHTSVEAASDKVSAPHIDTAPLTGRNSQASQAEVLQASRENAARGAAAHLPAVHITGDTHAGTNNPGHTPASHGDNNIGTGSQRQPVTATTGDHLGKSGTATGEDPKAGIHQGAVDANGNLVQKSFKAGPNDRHMSNVNTAVDANMLAGLAGIPYIGPALEAAAASLDHVSTQPQFNHR